MQAYEGYFENGQFYVQGQAIKIPERRRVIVNILQDNVKKQAKSREKILEEVHRLIREAEVEDIDFPERSHSDMAPPLDFGEDVSE